MTSVKVLENRLRRTADRLGYFVSKSRVTGLWTIRDEEMRFFSGGLDERDVTVEEVAEYLEAALKEEAEEREAREKEEERFFLEEAVSRFPRVFGAEGDDEE